MSSVTPDPVPDVHVVVFDVNVWMDLGRRDPGLKSFEDVVEAAKSHWVTGPASGDRLTCSLLAVACCALGYHPSPFRLEAWTSEHIDETLVHQLQQPPGDGSSTGLGWSEHDARAFLDKVVYGAGIDASGGGSIDGPIADGGEVLGNEDSKVYTTARKAAGTEYIARRFLVTNDYGILSKASSLRFVDVLSPAQFVRLVLEIRRKASQVRGPRPPL